MSSQKDSDKNEINTLIKQALEAIGLTEDEIELYIATIKRDIISIGEISNISNKNKEGAQKIIETFLEKGLFKEIVGVTPHYKALAPYTALINQLNIFSDLIFDIQNAIPPELEESLIEIVKKGDGTEIFNDYNKILTSLKDDSLS